MYIQKVKQRTSVHTIQNIYTDLEYENNYSNSVFSEI